MAYSKQTWTDDVSAVTGARMTHIEQGIYDNSLATDKINPSGTATTTAEIEEGQISDVIGFKSLKLKGQTSQYTTNGINLCEAKLPTTTQSGVTLTNNGDGTYKLNGTNSSSGTITFRINQGNGVADNLQDYEDGAYTLDLGVAIPNVQMCLTQNSTYTNFLVTDYGVRLISGTLSSVTNTFIYIAITTGTTINNVTIKPMLVKGTYTTSTMPNFEPYTGGKASPNPDYPQDVNNVSGYNVVGIGNKNLIENETFVQGSHHDNTGAKRISCRNIKLKANTTYTFSSNLNYSTYNVGLVTSKKSFPIINGEQIYDSGWKTSNFSFTTGNDDVYANIAVKKVGELTIVPSDVSTYHFQIEQGSTATSYIAHQGNEFEINLATNVVYSPRIWQNTSTVATQTNRLFSTPQKLVKAGTYKLATTLDFTTYKYALGVGTTPYPFASNLHDSGWKTTNNFSHTIPKGFVGIIVTRLDNANITSDEMKGVKFELRDTTLDDYDIELCKISTYEDYIYKKDGKWFKHKEIGRKTLNGSETWTRGSTNTSGKGRFQINLGNLISNNIVKPSSNANVGLILSDLFIVVVAGTNGTYDCHEGISLDISGYVQIYDETQYASDVATFKTWLANHNTNLYWAYSTPIDEEITYAPLLRQLDELYNSGLYDVTNISQDNSSEAFILDLEACKNNINGIVEYIRR